jgi:hypothetical protein
MPVQEERTMPVSKRALVQRVNRVLVKQDERLLAIRSERWRRELGDYYTIIISMNAVRQKHVDLETMAKSLEVLKPYERLVDE